MQSGSELLLPILVAGGGIGGISAALALAAQGHRVHVFEQARELGEIGAGVQLGPNAFAALEALGVGDAARALAVYTERMELRDAIDGSVVCAVPFGPAFRERFGNPYAVIHRADLHATLVERARQQAGIEITTGARVAEVRETEAGVELVDAAGEVHLGAALVGCDGVKSVVRGQLVGDAVRVSGHVVYRAVVDAADFPEDLRLNAPIVWGGPDCHLVHYPLRGGEQFNLVVTFHSREAEEWGVREGSPDEVLSYFQGISESARRLLALPKSWRRWSTADREPIGRWSFGRQTLLGDAAHPMLQYLAQGACMAMEDAATLGRAVAANPGDLAGAFARYERSRLTRTARVVLMTREMGRVYHAKGVERLVRNELWKGRSPERTYDALEWLYAWRAETCLAA